MQDRDTVVFVEVHHRLRAAHSDAAASVTFSRQVKLIKAAELWLAAHPQRAKASCRFDVVTYDRAAENACMAWIREAFEAQ
jgi:putative endonuclease